MRRCCHLPFVRFGGERVAFILFGDWVFFQVGHWSKPCSSGSFFWSVEEAHHCTAHSDKRKSELNISRKCFYNPRQVFEINYIYSLELRGEGCAPLCMRTTFPSTLGLILVLSESGSATSSHSLQRSASSPRRGRRDEAMASGMLVLVPAFPSLQHPFGVVGPVNRCYCMLWSPPCPVSLPLPLPREPPAWGWE